ncbi:MAG: hypothetical protein GXP48_04820 [Acidobacteria bacterium]|nr:hypothetical protein [Acidobacteriota bacterium]
MTTLVILGATALHVLVAAAILGGCLLVGLFILPAGWLRGQGWHDLPVALSAGITVVGLVMWIAATTLATWAALVAAGLLVTISLGKIPRAWRASVSLAQRVVPLLRHYPVTAVLILATIVLLIPQLALPPMGSDAVRYHLAEPKLALLTGKLSFDPYNLKSGLPQIIEMLDLVPIAIGCAGAAKAMQTIFFVLNLLLLTLIVHRGRRTRRAAMLAPLLFAWSPVVLAPAAAAFIDHGALFQVAVAMLLLTRRGRPELEGIALAGALATKPTTAPAVVLLALVALVRAARRGWIQAFLKIAIPIAVAMAPFAIRNLIATGDPIFPIGHVLVGRPIPGVPHSGVLMNTQFHAAIHAPLGIGWSARLWPVQPDEAVGLHHLLLGFIALLIAVKKRWIRPLLAPIFGYIAVGLFLHVSARFDFPMFWAMAAFEATALELWIGKLSIPAGIVVALPAAIAAAGVVTSTFSPMAYLEGRLNREQLLRRNVPGYAAAQKANAAIQHGWIMALDFPAPYYLDHPWIAESIEETPPLERWVRQGMTASEIVSTLQRLHVRLILITPGYGGGTPFSMVPLASNARQVETIGALRRRLHRLATVDSVDLWEVPRAP